MSSGPGGRRWQGWAAVPDRWCWRWRPGRYRPGCASRLQVPAVVQRTAQLARQNSGSRAKKQVAPLLIKGAGLRCVTVDSSKLLRETRRGAAKHAPVPRTRQRAAHQTRCTKAKATKPLAADLPPHCDRSHAGRGTYHRNSPRRRCWFGAARCSSSIPSTPPHAAEEGVELVGLRPAVAMTGGGNGELVPLLQPEQQQQQQPKKRSTLLTVCPFILGEGAAAGTRNALATCPRSHPGAQRASGASPGSHVHPELRARDPGRPRPRPQQHRRRPMPPLHPHPHPASAGNEFCERLAFYGLATNLVTYITQVMGGDPAGAAIQVSLFEGTCYITPLIGRSPGQPGLAAPAQLPGLPPAPPGAPPLQPLCDETAAPDTVMCPLMCPRPCRRRLPGGLSLGPLQDHPGLLLHLLPGGWGGLWALVDAAVWAGCRRSRQPPCSSGA